MKYLILFLVVYVKCLCDGQATHTTARQFSCPMENSSMVSWPDIGVANGHCIESEPLCLDNKKLLITRDCIASEWKPNAENLPPCAITQSSYESMIDKDCPFNYRYLIRDLFGVPVCIQITDPQIWSEQCSYAGSSKSIFDLSNEIADYLQKTLISRGISKVWLPARYIYGTKSIQWRLPGKLSEFVDPTLVTIDIDPNLLVSYSLALNFENYTYSLSMEHVTQNYPLLCIYYEEKPLLQLSCPDGSLTQRYRTEHYRQCYKLNDVDSPLTHENIVDIIRPGVCSRLYEMDSIEKIRLWKHIYKNLGNINQQCCVFTVLPNLPIPITKEYFSTITDFVKNVNWGCTRENFEPPTFLSADRDGKWLFRTTADCFVCEENPYSNELVGFSFRIIFNKQNESIKLLLTELDKLWRQTNNIEDGVHCFYLNEEHEYAQIVEIQYQYVSEAEIVYNVAGTEFGYYWCEAYEVENFNHVSTVRIRAFYDGFMVLCGSKCTSESMCDATEKICEVSVTSVFITYPDLTLVGFLKKGHIKENDYITIAYVIDVFLVDRYVNPEPNDIDLNKTILKVYNERQIIFNVLTENPTLNKFEVNSNDYCLPSSLNDTGNWVGARIGETVETRTFCVTENGILVRRKCELDDFSGSYWVQLTHPNEKCANMSEVTKELFQLNDRFVEAGQTAKVLIDLYKLLVEPEILRAVDILFSSIIIGKIDDFNANKPLGISEIDNLFSVYNNLMSINENIAKKAAKSNATNSLLISFENIVNNLTTIENPNNSGIRFVATPKLITYLINPRKSNVTGMVVYATNTEVTDLSDCNIRLLQKNQSYDALLAEPQLKVASFIPETLLHSMMQEQTTTFAIVITIFINNILFRVARNNKPADRVVISISVPAIKTKDISKPIPIFFKSHQPQNMVDLDQICVYWDFMDGWSNDGLTFVTERHGNILCNTTHLTHFAHLINSVLLDAHHEYILDMITICGCSLSIFGILGIVVSAILFRSWRQKTSSKLLLHLSGAVAMQIILLCFINTDTFTIHLLETNRFVGCVLLGGLLHYSLLVVFLWMVIIAYLQFMRYVIVFNQVRTNHFILKSSCISWGLPTIPIIIIVLIDPSLYIPIRGDSSIAFCYPHGNALLFGIIVPIGIICTTNLIIYIIVLYNLFLAPKTVPRITDYNETMAHFRVSVFLFFLLGLTWIFGLMAKWSNTTILFSYLFCLTGTLQGLVLFFYFIVLDPIARGLWLNLIRKMCCCIGQSIDGKSNSNSSQLNKY